MTGILYGVGVGPGDPELLTVKAVRTIEAADVVAYHAGRPGSSIARAAAAPYLTHGQLEEELVYPVTRGTTDHPGGYAGALSDFYDEAARRLAAHLEAGRSVALLAEGDPTLYSSYAHLHRRLARFERVIVPGVSSVLASAAAAGAPLTEAGEVLSIVPGTLPDDRLEAWAQRADALVFMKVSKNLDGIRRALAQAGRLGDARVVSLASRTGQTVAPLAEVADPPYMSTVVVPGVVASGRAAEPRTAQGSVTVIGLGPAGPQWLTPEAAEALAAAEEVVGYTTYVERVPPRAGQKRHLSDNRVEAERADFALALARKGRRVAVVSSGDPGVFAMATAVLEVQAENGYDDVAVRVLPGVTAANAVAARVGAPLGHDYCVVSLSDQLKPWEVVRRRLEAAAAADLVLALYNTGSKTRRAHIDEVREILLAQRKPGTPVVVGRAVGEAGESVRVIRLADLTPADVDMRTLLIIGSTTTRWVDGLVFTPRSYPG